MIRLCIAIAVFLCGLLSAHPVWSADPPWMDGELPFVGSAASEGYYVVAKGTSTSASAAYDAAIRDFMKDNSFASGVRTLVTSEEGRSDVHIISNENQVKFEVIDRVEKNERGLTSVYLLLWVLRENSNGMLPPRFQVKYERITYSSRSDGGAFLCSFFVPGLGQMYKRHYLRGGLYMAGTLGALSGAVACNLKYKKIRAAEQELGPLGLFWTSKGWRNATILGYALAGAFYVVQLVDATVCDTYYPPERVTRSYEYVAKLPSLNLAPWLALEEVGTQPVLGAQLRISF